MWCLAWLLPLMIGELVPQNDPYWQNFVLLLTITDYIFAPVTSDDITSYIKVLLKEHHERFCELYPNAPAIPKMHYMLHLPEWMERYVECLCDKYISLMQHRFEFYSSYYSSYFNQAPTASSNKQSTSPTLPDDARRCKRWKNKTLVKMIH